MKDTRRKKAKEAKGENWDEAECRVLIDELWALRDSVLAFEQRLQPRLAGVDPAFQLSARNFAHYLALRRKDRRPLQEKLAWIGVSSLGRAESNVLANLDKVLGILHRLIGEPWVSRSQDEPLGIKRSGKLLEQHTTALLGDPPPGRSVRIMVTLPSEAAADYGLIRTLVDSGMDIARINCAHDGPAQWRAMARHVRRAAKAAGRAVLIEMDLAGPKIRTGALPAGTPLLKIRPQRDELGRVLVPARLGLHAAGAPAPVAGATASVGVDAEWLAGLEVGDQLCLTDARGARRRFEVVRVDENGALLESQRTSYLVPETRIAHRRGGRHRPGSSLHDLPVAPGALSLQRGATLLLTREDYRPAPARFPKDKSKSPPLPRIACTLPEVFGQVCVGERVWFDDGKIGGVIRRAKDDRIEVEITHARDVGEKLAADKGINFPDSQLALPALTAKDIEDLAVVAKEADLVGLSFVQRASDVEALRAHLRELGSPDLGIVLKIETRQGFDKLPELLFAAMAGKAAGIMIARGDLAVECGYERLAEVQEELLWAAEAAHMPVIWATQVLETLAKTGLPSRAEVTDAAMSERAECVMLNKGPHIADAMRTLDDILRRMQGHQLKKRPLLRALHAWSMDEAGGDGAP